MAGVDGLIAGVPEAVREASLVLPLAATGDDRVDVELVDLTRKTLAGARIAGRALVEGQQHHLTTTAVGQIGDARGGGHEACVQPEVTDPRGIGGMQGDGVHPVADRHGGFAGWWQLRHRVHLTTSDQATCGAGSRRALVAQGIVANSPDTQET